MKNLSTLLIAFALVSCGDDGAKTPDAPVQHDSKMIDAPSIPPAPALGAQIDRMGRPAINTALNHGFDGTSAAGPAKDAYNQDQSMGTWPMTYLAQFGGNLAIIDSLDTGLSCTLGTCTAEPAPANGDGCGNQALYNGIPGGQKGMPKACPGATCSYNSLAGVLGDDELYLDTSQSMCHFYLAYEFGVVTGGGSTDCGGRAPSYDVMDTTYTVAAIGIAGFSATFVPAIQDGVSAHADINDGTFPFLGAAH